MCHAVFLIYHRRWTSAQCWRASASVNVVHHTFPMETEICIWYVSLRLLFFWGKLDQHQDQVRSSHYILSTAASLEFLGYTHSPHTHIFMLQHSVCRWHPSSHMLGYISAIMVAMLMIRAICFKWVIISGRLPCDGDEGFDRYMPSGNRWRWWATEASCYCVLSRSPCVSSTSSSLHLFVLWFNFQITGVRSSQVLPVCRTTARPWIPKEDSGTVWDEVSGVFIELWSIYDSNLIWGITFGLLFCMFKI